MNGLLRNFSTNLANLTRQLGWFRETTLGERGERAAADHLKRQGLRIVTRGFRNPYGEIDIIALDGETLVFVEVKTRRSDAGGHPTDNVDARKQEQIGRLAMAFCKQHRLMKHKSRFDVVAVTWPADCDTPTIEHFSDAFALPSVGIRR